MGYVMHQKHGEMAGVLSLNSMGLVRYDITGQGTD